jgi:hypothetical protein
MAKKGYSKDKSELQAKAFGTMRSFQPSNSRVANFFENINVKYAKYNA